MTGRHTNDYTRQLELALAATGVTGASFAYWDGEKLHTAVAGLRNSVTADPVTPDTLMHIGSITKVLNAVLMMQLVDEGALSLDDPVAKHLPELRLRDMRAPEQITCAMLVNHTSGIDGMWLPEVGPDEERIVDTIYRCANLKQLHVPGEAASYCNVATVIAGYLTQKLRGMSWYSVVSRRIYGPLGLTHSLVELADIPRFRCSIGDIFDRKAIGDRKTKITKLVQTTRPFGQPSFAPAGSTQMMTATDLLTFARALLDGGVGPNGERILSAASAAQMAEPTAAFTTMPSSSIQIGLGWMILPGDVLYHGGGGPGVSSSLYAHHATGRVLVLLRNSENGLALNPLMVDPILKSWTGLKDPAPPRRLSGTVDPKPYEGVYECIMYRIEVFSRDDGLIMRYSETPGTRNYAGEHGADAVPPVTLYPMGHHAFEAEGMGPGWPRAEFKFMRPDRAGRMQLLCFGGLALLARTQ